MNLNEKPFEIVRFDAVRLVGGKNPFSFSIDSGCIHALFSDNPSTSLRILRCLAGSESFDSGFIHFEGTRYRRINCKLAKKLGIEIVDNSNRSFLRLSVLDNLYCERKITRFTHRKSRALTRDRAVELFSELGIEIDLKACMGQINPYRRKLLELARSIIASPKILCIEESTIRDILDHSPPGTSEKLQYVLLRLVNNGAAILWASNDINKIFVFANTISVIKNDVMQEKVTVQETDKFQLMQAAYGSITSRAELEKNNFELFYYKQLYQEIIDSLIFPMLATDTHHNIIIYNNEVQLTYLNGRTDLVGESIQSALGLSNELMQRIERELLYFPESRVYRLADVFPGTQIYVSSINDDMGSYMGMLYVFDRSNDRSLSFDSILRKSKHFERDYKLNELIHEVKNPLGIILNYLSLIQKETSVTVIQNETQYIVKEVARISRLLDNLKISNSGLHTKPNVEQPPITLAKIIQEILEFLKPTIESSSIQFHTDFSDEYVVSHHEDLLRQVFLNIILNATEVMHNGGIIQISGRYRILQNVNYYTIQIMDNGPGILPENLPLIFDPFFTTKTDRDSHGIGLSITKDIVERLNGSIRAESVLGEGAIFIIDLPIQ